MDANSPAATDLSCSQKKILPSLPWQRRMRGDQKEEICFFLFVWFPQTLANSPHRFTPSIKVWAFQSISPGVGQQQWLWGRSRWLVVTFSKLNIFTFHSKTSRFVLIPNSVFKRLILLKWMLNILSWFSLNFLLGSCSEIKKKKKKRQNEVFYFLQH